MSATEYRPPADIWQVNQQLHFDEPLEVDDPRFVHTEKGRGDFSFARLLRWLGVQPDADPARWQVKLPPKNQYAVFCGHRGCGKSTELRRLGRNLHRNDLFFVVQLDVVRRLDPHDLQYPELLLALAHALCEALEERHISLDQVFLDNLTSWFDERIEKRAETQNFAIELKAGAKAKTGLPFIATLFAGLSASFKNNSTYTSELRAIVKNSYAQFARALDQLLSAAEFQIQQQGLGQTLLFIIDGTDRLSEEDSRRLFVDDVYQLQQVRSNFIYCAPIQMIYEGNQVRQSFEHFVLPMIKLTDKRGAQENPEGYEALRNLVLRRAAAELFDNPATLDYLIRHSGGSPRELIRLLSYTFQYSSSELFDAEAARRAVEALATDYRRFLKTEDYALLYQIDQSADAELDKNDERIRFLLLHLALLEYNGFWWRSHPAVQTLGGYLQQAQTQPARTE